MTTLVTIAVLLAALAHAGWNAMVKGRGAQGDPLAGTIGLCVVWVVIGVPLLFVVTLPRVASWPHLGASVLIHEVYLVALVAAYRRADLSLVYPISRGLPPMVLLLSGWLLLDESPSFGAIGGVVLITAGVLAIGLPRGARGSAAMEPNRSRNAATLALTLGIAACISLYTTVDGVGVRASGSALGYAVWLFTLQGAVFALAGMVWGGPGARAAAWARRRTAVVAGALSAGGYAVALWAMSLAPIALVAALRETSIVFAALLGAKVLHEPLGAKRTVAAGIVAAGVVLVRVAG